MKPGVIPYGYAYLEGQLVISPNEYKIVLLVVKLWQSEKSFKAIARLLKDSQASKGGKPFLLPISLQAK